MSAITQYQEYQKSPDFQRLEKQILSIEEMHRETMKQIETQFPLPSDYHWGISLANELRPWYRGEPEKGEE